MNKKNLLKLADFLEGVEPEKFDMRNYRAASRKDTAGVPYNGRDNCGTVGCALGWAPFAINKEPESDNESVFWDKYSRVHFGLEEESAEWSWCFSPTWCAWDNSPEGASKRIRYMLKEGVPRQYRIPEIYWVEVYQ